MKDPMLNPDYATGYKDGLSAGIAQERAKVNTPHTADFIEAVKLEAEHQRQRWGTDNDAGKAPHDWYWLLAYLSGKALMNALAGNIDKAKHHTISSAAMLLNWHMHLSGEDTRMRPLPTPPKPEGE